MESGLILLAFIAVLCTLGFSKVRRKMGLGMTSKHWVVGFAVVFLLILVVWANGHT
jgi:hydrogenase-4 membrane subunit HyfE